MPLDNERVLDQFKDLIRITCGFSFALDREETLLKALQARMKVRGAASPEGYHAILIRERDELNSLIELLTVNETYFFRESQYLKLVTDTLAPELLAARRVGMVRILSAGCSTGEEPYSIAMLLRERFGSECESLLRITGVDIDSKAIATARKGIYGKSSFRGIDPAMQERYFIPEAGGSYRICDAVRRQVDFEVVNLLDTGNSLGMLLPDIILYRNVSIYFQQDVQQSIFSCLADLLNDGGYLIVGASETLHHDVGILSLVNRNALFFYCKSPTIAIVDRRVEKRQPPPIEKVTAVPKFLPPVAEAPVSALLPPQATPVRARIMAQPGGNDPRECFDSALDKARTGFQDEALALLETIIARDATFVKAHGLKASLLMNAARFDDAYAVGETMLELDPFCLEGCLILGMIARHRGDDGEAFKRFREALYIDAACWLAHFYTAEIMFVRKEGKRARGSYETVVNILENGSLQELGQAYFPLAFNAQQFISICRHKLSLLKENG